MNSSSLDNYLLIVEDNEDLRSLYEEAMTLGNHSVRLAANGQEALDIVHSSKHKPKIIILDLMMPVMNGWEFLERRSQDEALSKVPVIVCSASKERIPSDVAFLKKPVDLDQLFKIAESYL